MRGQDIDDVDVVLARCHRVSHGSSDWNIIIIIIRSDYVVQARQHFRTTLQSYKETTKSVMRKPTTLQQQTVMMTACVQCAASYSRQQSSTCLSQMEEQVDQLDPV